MTPNFRDLLPLLVRANIKFIVIGGGAAIAHGSGRATYDVDIVYARDANNIHNLVAALEPYKPYLRGAPPGLPFNLDLPVCNPGKAHPVKTGSRPSQRFGVHRRA
jgi:hypothetical protein